MPKLVGIQCVIFALKNFSSFLIEICQGKVGLELEPIYFRENVWFVSDLGTWPFTQPSGLNAFRLSERPGILV